MKAKNKKPHDFNEKKIIKQIDIQKHCKREIRKFYRLIRKKEFSTDLALQKEVALIARAIFLKIQSIDIATWFEMGEIDEFTKAVEKMARQYEGLFSPQSIALQVTGPDGGPISHSLTVKGQMDIGALRDALKRSGKTE
jgi:vacuolar-type H+-ATPase subunit I/STV1